MIYNMSENSTNPFIRKLYKCFNEYDMSNLEAAITPISGGISSSISRAVTQPLDVIKVRLQLQVEPARYFFFFRKPVSKYRTVIQTYKLIVHEEGYLTLWNGHLPGQLLSFTHGLTQFFVFEELKKLLLGVPIIGTAPKLVDFLSGAVAGGCAHFIVAPIDIVKTRIIAQDNKLKKHAKQSSMTIFREIVSKNGFRGLYQGFAPGLTEVVPSVGLTFMFYQILREIAEATSLDNDMKQLPSWKLLVLGATSGSLAKTITYPFDLVKKRLQIQGFQARRRAFGKTLICSSMIQCFKLIITTEGYISLYRGMVPTLLRSSLMSAINFCTYDKLKLMLTSLLKSSQV